MALHAEDALRCASISQIFNFPFTVATLEATGAKSFLAGENGEIFNLIAASTATVSAVVADQRAITEEEEVRIRVKECAAGVAAKTIDVPSVSG